jgi:hypothetical protein
VVVFGIASGHDHAFGTDDESGGHTDCPPRLTTNLDKTRTTINSGRAINHCWLVGARLKIYKSLRYKKQEQDNEGESS